ncbi:MAG TPA: nuclear transport factor 2 family protein [Nitrolancea sp.]|nr:nuclear transport factor 2 family protein [Nitrolancea sp.]
MSQHNVETVQRVFGAFGRGDIPTILDAVSEDTVWGFNVRDSQIPWHTSVCGKANLPQFFGALMGNVDFQVFEPRDFIASGDSVVAHVHMEYRVKKTGKPVNEDALFWWRFSSDGKIASLTHFEDTAQVRDAYQG